MTSLRFETGPRTGEAVVIDKSKFTFGRQLDCDCVLKHLTVSRVHFYIELNGGKHFLVDEHSGNGTFVNGQQVSWVEMKNGDKIQAGPFVFSVELSGGEAQEAGSTVDLEEHGDESPMDERHGSLYPREYLEGIRFFNTGGYFDAHEIWEEIWLRSSGDTKLFYQTLIQAAVGLHHYGRGNMRGARGMYKNVMEKLERLPDLFMSLDLEKFRIQFASFFTDLELEEAPAGDRQPPTIRLVKDELEDRRGHL
jgi:predicted metal-dependent hydrolase